MTTFLQRFRGGVEPRAVRASVLENPAVPLTSLTLLDWLTGPRSDAGVPVTEQSALGIPAVWRAVNLIGGTAASLPLKAYRTVDDVRVPQIGGAGADLLANPHPDMTSFELWECAYAHDLLWGNAYLLKLRDQNNRVKELWPLHPSRVRAGRDKDGFKVYQVDGNGHADTGVGYSDLQILHIPGFGYDGICGVSPIRLARQGIGLALAAEKYGAKLFGSGSLMSGILQTEQRLDEPQATALKERWRAKMTGLEHAHEVAVLDSGAKFQQLSIPPEDAQFIETRQFQNGEVARIFGIPPHMMADTEKSTSWGTGIEQQSIAFVVYTLRPWLTRFEQRVSQMLAPGSVYARYSVEGLLRGDSAQRASFYTAMWQIGVLSTNDIRRLEDLAPVEGGDVRYRPLNMGELGAPDPAVAAAAALLDPAAA